MRDEIRLCVVGEKGDVALSTVASTETRREVKMRPDMNVRMRYSLVSVVPNCWRMELRDRTLVLRFALLKDSYAVRCADSFAWDGFLLSSM